MCTFLPNKIFKLLWIAFKTEYNQTFKRNIGIWTETFSEQQQMIFFPQWWVNKSKTSLTEHFSVSMWVFIPFNSISPVSLPSLSSSSSLSCWTGLLWTATGLWLAQLMSSPVLLSSSPSSSSLSYWTGLLSLLWLSPLMSSLVSPIFMWTL